MCGEVSVMVMCIGVDLPRSVIDKAGIAVAGSRLELFFFFPCMDCVMN